MAGLKKNVQESPFGASGLNLTLNLHKGYKLSVAGFPLPAGVEVTSSNPKVCTVSVSNGVVSLAAPETGEAVLTASFAGITVPGQATVKVW